MKLPYCTYSRIIIDFPSINKSLWNPGMFSLRNSIHKNVGLFIRFWMFTAEYCKPLARGPTECACSTICSTGWQFFYDSFSLNMQRYQPSTCCVYINPKFLMVLNRSFDGHSKSRVNRPSNGLEPPSFNLSNHFFSGFRWVFPSPLDKRSVETI